MSLRIKIAGGGTNAGWRIVTEPRPDWVCSYGHFNKGRDRRCMTSPCNERRPK